MTGIRIAIGSGVIAAIGTLVAIIGITGCTVYSITPSASTGTYHYPAFMAISVIGIAIVIGSSFVEAGSARKRESADDCY
jgi:hypothetical protein